MESGRDFIITNYIIYVIKRIKINRLKWAGHGIRRKK
jgi:hypothetical protein